MSRAPYAKTETVDAVVIGTGAGGAPLTARLAEAGLSVVALEAGRSFTPSEHVADELAADIYWMEERLSGGNDPTAFGSNNSGMGVGGSTLHWGAFCPRPDPRDLQLKTMTGQGADWPVPHGELIAYVEFAKLAPDARRRRLSARSRILCTSLPPSSNSISTCAVSPEPISRTTVPYRSPLPSA